MSSKPPAEKAQCRGKRIHYWHYLFSHAAITSDIVTDNYEGSGTASDPYKVHWIERDPRDPKLMPPAQKAMITALAAIITLASTFASSTYSGCMIEIEEDMQASEEVVILGISLYVLGLAIGPLLWAPLGELYGRQIILFISYGGFTAFGAGAVASQNIATLVVLRFLSGCFASSSTTNTGGIIADIYTAEQRGFAMAMFAAAPFMGPVLGPIAGGFLGEKAGWRWVQGLTAIFSGLLWVLAALLIPETYAPLLLRKRAEKLSQITGNAYVSAIDFERGTSETSRSAWKEVVRAMTRPWVLLVHEPSVLLLSLYMSYAYGILFMLFGAFPIVYQEERHWSEGEGGLAFLGVLLGEFLSFVYYYLENRRYIRRGKRKGHPQPPEERLIPSMAAAIAMPIGLFWFAWTNGPSVHPVVSILAGAPFGFAICLIFISIKNYLVDAYMVFAASALAVAIVMRSIFAAAFPLFTTYMYHNLGIHWASTLVAMLALVCAPIPFALYHWGGTIRQRCKYSREAIALAARANAGERSI